MYPAQSSEVTMPDAIANNALGDVHTWKIPSLALRMLFTWLKTSSKGIRSIKRMTGSTWWMEQLPIITTDLGLVPSMDWEYIYIYIGINVSVTNSSNLSPLTDPSTSWASCIPSSDIPEYLTPRARSLWSQGGMPLTLYPYLLLLFRRSHAVSSIQPNIAGSYMEISAIYLALHSSEHCSGSSVDYNPWLSRSYIL